jgi:HlyD family secretion protein
MTTNLPVALAPFGTQIAPYDPIEGMDSRLRRAWMLIAFLVFGLGGAAAIVPIGGAVVGNGQIGVESRVKQITHPAGGTVARIAAENGQHVRKGQVLLQLDDKVSGTDARLSTLSVDQMLAQHARLEAERLGADSISFPPELTSQHSVEATKAMEDESKLFRIRREEQAGIIAQLNDRVRQSQLQIAGYQAQIDSLQKQAKLIEPERAGVHKLWEKGLVTIRHVNELERTAVDYEGSIGALRANIAQSEAKISEAREQIIQMGETRRADAGTQLAQVNATLNQQQVRSVSAVDLHERSLIRAPYDGIVDKMVVTTVGGVIKPADVIMEIVPDRDQLLVEAAISPNDVDQIQTGQKARIRFTGFNSTATPEIPGKVVLVAPERTTDPQTRQSYFAVRVAIDAAAVKKEPNLKLRPGLPAEIFIETGNRTMLSYLTKPLRDQLARAFRDN